MAYSSVHTGTKFNYIVIFCATSLRTPLGKVLGQLSRRGFKTNKMADFSLPYLPLLREVIMYYTQ